MGLVMKPSAGWTTYGTFSPGENEMEFFWSRWLGVGSQLAVFVLGLIGCAKWLTTKEDA
jgi:hypothetical protein